MALNTGIVSDEPCMPGSGGGPGLFRHLVRTGKAQPGNTTKAKQGKLFRQSAFRSPGGQASVHLRRSNQVLDVYRDLVETLHPSPELTQGVLDHHKVEPGNDDIVPTIADSPQGYIKHGHDLMAQQVVRLQRNCSVELLAFCVPGIVSSRVWLLVGQVNLTADPPSDFVGVGGKKVNQRLLLELRGQALLGHFDILVIADLISPLHHSEPAGCIWLKEALRSDRSQR